MIYWLYELSEPKVQLYELSDKRSDKNYFDILPWDVLYVN